MSFLKKLLGIGSASEPPPKGAQPHVHAPSTYTHNEEFWAEKARRLKREGHSDAAVRECRKNIPYPAAFREIAIALRKEIRARRKQHVDARDLLIRLYQCSVIENFFTDVQWSRIVNDRILHSTAQPFVEEMNAPYEVIGYRNLALLNKTDVKWLIEAFGEPERHSTAKDANRDLWRRAVKAFQAAAQRDEQQFWR